MDYKSLNNTISNEQQFPESIAVVGIGLRFPGESFTPDQLWENLLGSFDGIVEVPAERWSPNFYEHKLVGTKNAGLIPLDEWKKFDSLFFGLSPKDAPELDPQERMLLKVTYEALEDAQIPASQVRGSRTAVYVGVSNIDNSRLIQRYSVLDGAAKVLNDTFTFSVIANRVSYCFDFRGPSMCVDTACSSSLITTDLACQALISGNCDMAITSGISALFDPETTNCYSDFGVIGDQCRSFDANGKGFVRSEGCGVVILKRLSDAERDNNRIYAVIKGGNTNTDGHCNKDTMSTPSYVTQSENIERALRKTGVDPKDVYYVEAHATGTVVGDPIEVTALSKVFSEHHTNENPLKIGSIKANIGHLESGAGIASLIKVSLMLKNRKLVPNIKLTTLNPKIPFNDWNIQVVTKVEDLPQTERPILMGINSFGIGGANCHLILEEYRNELKPILPDTHQIEYLVPISGNSAGSLDKYIESIVSNTELQKKISFKEFVLHQSFSKSHMTNRKVIIAKDWEDFKNNQKSSVQFQLPSLNDSKGKKVAFVFCGQGPQWNQMGMQLYHSEPVYKSIVDRYDSLLKEYTGYSIIEKMNEIPNQSNDIHKPIIAQPSLFLFQIGLFELYKNWGIHPSFVVGHSFGDITSAYISGSISLTEAIKVVHFRSVFQNETIGSGRMLVVGMSFNDYQTKFQSQFPTLEIACFNSPESIVVTGDEASLTDLVKHLKLADLFNTFLRTPCSFHSSHQKVIKSKIMTTLGHMTSTKPTIPWYSTVTGELQTKGMDAQYLYNNIRRPVQFQKTMETIAKNLGDQLEDYIFLEIAPHPTLSSLIKQCIPQAVVISPIQRNKDEQALFKLSLANVHCYGANVEFKTQFKISEFLNISWKDSTTLLPRYQWDDELYWKESAYSHHKRINGPPTTILGHLGVHNGQQVYHSDIDIKRSPFRFLKDHQVKDKPLFPGAGYAEAIIQAFKSNGQDIVINKLEFLNPFFLHEKETPPKMQTVIDRLSNNDYKIQFFNKNGEAYNPNEQWVKTAQSRVSFSDTTVVNHHLDIESFKKQCNLTTFNQREFYQMTERVGLKYGPSFQHVTSIMVGEKCTLATLIPKSTAITPPQILNTTLIDNCAHGMMGLLDERRQFVFKSIEDMRINIKLMNELDSGNLPQELYLATTILDSNNYNYTGHCLLLLPDGQVLLEMERFTVTTPEKLRMSKIKFPQKELCSTVIQSKDLPTDVDALSLSKSFIQDSLKSQAVSTVDAILILVIALTNNIPGFNIKDIQSHSIEELFDKYGINRSKSNDRLFIRCLEILGQYMQHFNDQTFTPEFALALESKYSNSESNEYTVVKLSCDVIAQVLLGNGRAPEVLFNDGLLENFYTKSPFMKYYLKQLSHVVTSSIKPIVEKQEKRLINILEIGGGTGALTHLIISQLDEILEGQNQVEVYYTFTDVSPAFIYSMKDRYQNKQKLKSNLHLKFRLYDLEKDSFEQGYLPGHYDYVLMAYVIHIVPHLKESLSHIQKLITPSGLLAFSEPNYKYPLVDIMFGGFTQIWNFEDDIRDHYTLRPQQWIDLLSEETGYKNTRVFGSVDEKGEPLSLESGHSVIVVAQRSGVNQLPPTHEPCDHLTVIVKDGQQPIPIESLRKYTNNLSIIKCNEIESNLSLLEHSSHIFLVAGVEHLTLDNYQSVTFDASKLIKLFIKKPNQPIIAIVTRDCQTNNYFANSLNGITKSGFCDHYEINLSFIDVDSQLNDNNIKLILQIVNNYSSLGDFEYYIKENKVHIERTYHNAIENLQTSVAYEKDQSKLGCHINIGLEYKLFERPELEPEQIEVSIKSAGLNFKDYLFHLHMLQQDFMDKGDPFHPPIGLEHSGIVTRVGSAVTKFKVGDEVVGAHSHSISSHAINHVKYFTHKPKEISFHAAASVPVVYGTVYHAFFKVCQLDPENDTVLVHSATGGVGLAALSILRWKGCKKVYATCGSQEKMDYLRANYSDILIDVFSSHTVDFARQIKQQCAGVDVLLNTLSSDYMNANFKALSPWGKIADISLTHVYNNEPLDYGNFKRDQAYATVDFNLLVVSRIEYTINMVNSLFQAMASGELDGPKIYKVYSACDAKKAVLSLKERKHIGKIVVDMSSIETEVLQPLIASGEKLPVPKANFKVDINHTVITTGQQGISLELIAWLSKFTNASDIVVLSISPLKSRLRKLINLNNKSSNRAKIHFIQTDVSKKQQLKTTMESIKQQYPPIETIFHLAAIYEDFGINELTLENIQRVHQPKVIGSINLHEITMELQLPIRQFILFSSISSISGTPSQPSYNSANLVIDAICQYRSNILGLPSKSMRFGPLLGEGLVAESVGIKEFFFSRGVASLHVSQFLGGLEAAISQPNKQFVNQIVSDITTQGNYDYNPKIKPKIEHHVDIRSDRKSSINRTDVDIYDTISNNIAMLLSMSASKLNGNTKLKDFGVDSLMTVQIKSFFDNNFEIDMFNVSQIPSVTINQIVSKVQSLKSN
ncbi:putative polyketide synthase [Heterostelium album PN500]|uniref:Putative polyketide synthase n=1 Tax=Heterostelium pallidum (strain ATCC 26659 / Pp 5 / PN500) TaxID=670386 RepID=D3AWI5_HETP5|nr:putative polyketide synthase [Heterostelium album PN500]EFA86658.1 putative polyketide synthase [Heterostelium album PN500]|eukprot:XP_020438763.1 putative polyketide synthase [Heterostelium album PN500]